MHQEMRAPPRSARRAVQPMLVRKEEDILLQAKATLDATEKLEETEQADLARPPSPFRALNLAAIPGLHEAVRAAVNPDVPECGQLGVDAVEREIIAGQLVAGVPDFTFRREVIADALDLAEIVAIADVACIEQRVEVMFAWLARKWKRSIAQ